LVGCTNYESEKYISFENEVIKEIIPELLNLEHYQIPNLENVSIFLVNELGDEIDADTVYEEKYEPISEDTILLVSREILSESLEERKLFKAFIKDQIKSRTLETEIVYENLNLKKVSFADFHNRNKVVKPDSVFNESITEVYLILTRISFDRKKEYGYLNYTIFCGEACFWTNNIEIKKTDNKWIVSRILSGSIA
jgi:hypothetical protein